jgi:hypothetical protein
VAPPCVVAVRAAAGPLGAVAVGGIVVVWPPLGFAVLPEEAV